MKIACTLCHAWQGCTHEARLAHHLEQHPGEPFPAPASRAYLREVNDALLRRRQMRMDADIENQLHPWVRALQDEHDYILQHRRDTQMWRIIIPRFSYGYCDLNYEYVRHPGTWWVDRAQFREYVIQACRQTHANRVARYNVRNTTTTSTNLNDRVVASQLWEEFIAEREQ